MSGKIGRDKRARGKVWRRGLLALILAGALSFGVLFGVMIAGARDDITGEPSLMLVLGCQVMPYGPSVLLQDRLDEALAYLTDHPDVTVVVSGGQGANEPVSEARAMADYLTDQGVDQNRILLEDRSNNTLQNFQYSKALLDSAGYDLDGGVIVVSNGFHLARARMLAQRTGFGDVSTLAAPSSHAPSRAYMYLREPLALVKSFLLDR
jgi:uncharacterized SAM-binding protein YcdF (DUF218 family)